MRIVDTKGQLCPAPLIAAKRALKESAEGEAFLLLTDNRVSYDNLCRFLRDNKAEFSVSEDSGVWSMTVTKSVNAGIVWPVENYCNTTVAHFEKGDFVVVISNDIMGEGDPQLGRLLLGNFLKALKDLDKLPASVLLYNNGVKIAVEGSELASHLEELEKMGVELLICATCVTHYNLADKISFGKLSNMFVIAQAMAAAGNVLKP